MGGSGESLNEILSQYDDMLGKEQGTVLYLDHVQHTFYAFYCDLKMIKQTQLLQRSWKFWKDLEPMFLHTFLL